MSAVGGKYELGERIGGGGMADVFRAVIRGAEGFSRSVAIKRIKRNISTDKAFAKLFVTEARLAACLMHPNVVQTIDFDRDETGCFYLVMELIEGVDLRELVKSGRVPVTAVVYIISEVLRALDYAHEMVADGQPLTIVHRDISPHNIMLGWQGAVKVVDFGIAKAIAGSLISRSGSLKGKVAYMSPEQVHGKALDGRSDLFAVGIIAHELLCGQRLFIDQTEAATLSQVLTKPIPSPRSLNDQVPEDLDRVVMTLLERDRELRYERSRDALDALLSCSLATSRGRSDLETVMAERFPEQAPKRVSRLSRSPEEAAQSARLKRGSVPPMGRPSTSVTAETQVASPAGKPARRAQPKRTETAMPARQSGGVDPVTGSSLVEPPVESMPTAASNTAPGVKRSVWPLRILLFALVGAVVVATILVTQGKGDQNNTEPSVELLGVQSNEPTQTVSKDAGARSAVPLSASDASPDAAAASARAGSEVAEKAKLTIRVKPWASIEIDGKAYGQTPQQIELRRGKHQITLSNPGLKRSQKVKVRLSAGKSSTIDLDWTKKNSSKD